MPASPAGYTPLSFEHLGQESSSMAVRKTSVMDVMRRLLQVKGPTRHEALARTKTKGQPAAPKTQRGFGALRNLATVGRAGF